MEQFLLFAIRTGVFLVLLMPLVVTTDTLFPFIVGKSLYARAVTEIIFGLWLVLAYRYPGYRPPRSWVLVAFAVYLAVAVVAGLAGVSVQRSLWSNYERMQGIVDLAHWFALILVVTSVVRSLPHWRTLLNFNLGISLVIAVLAVAQHYSVSAAVPLFDCLRPPQIVDRVEGCLGNSAYLGAYMLVNILIGLAILSQSLQGRPEPRGSPAQRSRRRRRRRRPTVARDSSANWWRLFWVTTIALDFWVLTLSGTRGAAVGLAAGLVVFAAGYMTWGRLRTVRLVSAGLIGILAAVALIVAFATNTAAFDRIASSNVLVGRLATTGLDHGTLRDRVASWSAGLEGLSHRPILGWGPENYIVAWGRYVAPGGTPAFDQAHNKPVEELTTKGALGLFSYLTLWALMFWIVVRRVRQSSEHEQLLVLFIGAALTGYFVQNLFLFDTPATVLQFMILLGFVVNLESTLEPVGARTAASLQTGSREETPKLLIWKHRLSQGLGSTLEASTAAGSVRRYAASNSALLSIYGLLAVLVLVSLSVYFANYRPYQAARAARSAVGEGVTFQQRLNHFQESIDTFRPLANYPRQFLFEGMGASLGILSDQEASQLLTMVEREAEEAQKSEPQSWRVQVALSSFYLQASAVDPAHLGRARLHFDSAAGLAPNAPEVVRLEAQLRSIEEQRGRAAGTQVEPG